MSTAEWNVMGLVSAMIGVLLLFQYGMPAKAGPRNAPLSWVALVLFVAGTLCQIWANVRWIG